MAYDFATDVMSDSWDPAAALRRMRGFPREEIADVLLDQTIFAGVGNIIKNEVSSFAPAPARSFRSEGFLRVNAGRSSPMREYSRRVFWNCAENLRCAEPRNIWKERVPQLWQ